MKIGVRYIQYGNAGMCRVNLSLSPAGVSAVRRTIAAIRARASRARGRLSSRQGGCRRGDEEGWSSQRPASIRAVLVAARYARGDVMAPAFTPAVRVRIARNVR